MLSECPKKPALRFPEFSGEWEEKRLGELGDTISGLTYSPKDIRDNGLLVLRSSNIKNDTILLDDCVYVTPQVNGYNEVSENDILICVRNGSEKLIGKNALIPKNIGLATFGAFMTVFRAYVPLFVIQLLKHKSYKRQVAADLGARINSINSGQLKRYRFFVPTPPEQKRIAKFLTSVDERIRQLEQKLELMEQYKKGMMQRLFSRERRFTDKNGNLYTDWDEKKLGDVFNRVIRKNKEKNNNVLTISARQGLVNQEEFFNKSVSAKDTSHYYLLHRDEFAYNKSYSLGYPMGAIKRLNNYDKGVVSTLYICFKSIDGHEAFYEQYFEAGMLNKEIHKIAQEGARNHGLLNISVNEFFDDITLVVPSNPDEQQKIADFLFVIDDKINHIKNQLEQTNRFKQGLLQQMFV